MLQYCDILWKSLLSLECMFYRETFQLTSCYIKMRIISCRSNPRPIAQRTSTVTDTPCVLIIYNFAQLQISVFLTFLNHPQQFLNYISFSSELNLHLPNHVCFRCKKAETSKYIAIEKLDPEVIYFSISSFHFDIFHFCYSTYFLQSPFYINNTKLSNVET